MGSESLLNLSRLQFAMTALFHVTLPTLTVGTSLFVAFLYAAWLRTRNPAWLALFRFWRRIFAVTFGLGVVTGIVLTFELGLNWGRYAHDVGPVVGPLLGMEVVSAFCLEAAFFGVMVYGENRVSERVMMFSVAMVSLGTLSSTTWIIMANTWMQAPTGYRRMSNGQFRVSDWGEVILNPLFGWRVTHMFLGALLGASLLVAGIGASYLRRGVHRDAGARMVSMAVATLLLVLPVQIAVGDTLGGRLLPYQPAKLLATEGHWQATSQYNLFIVPDEKAHKNTVQVSVPFITPLVIGKDWSMKFKEPPVTTIPAADRPALLWPFYGFRIMFFIAWGLLATALVGVVLRLRGRLYVSRRFLRLLTWLTPFGVFAVWGGWVTAEGGRQPWVVYNQLRTADAVSSLATWSVAVSIAVLAVVYATLATVWIRTVRRYIHEGPPRPEPVRAEASS
ncbi:cytochrome ubiquinol oxidase subunit I [Streptomyces sp. NPDC093544]|uniref:cytochrome ubiquinol oxidase subunit I n=1 Tax=Streptomyces sp. NPDC093544 TaxID=3155200 RepID=UPI0034447D28